MTQKSNHEKQSGYDCCDHQCIDDHKSNKAFHVPNHQNVPFHLEAPTTNVRFHVSIINKRLFGVNRKMNKLRTIV